MGFDASQQKIGQHIGEALAIFLAVAAAAEERIGFVKEQYHIAGGGLIEQLREVFFRLTDVFIHDRR